MIFVFRPLLVSAFLLLMQSQLCLASDPNSIVWLANDVSIKGVKQIDLYPIAHDIRHSYVHQVSSVITAIIRGDLEQAGITVTNINENELPKQFGLETQIVRCQPGDVGGRWVGFGGGSAVCILRTKIISGYTGEVVGEVIVANDVSVGGLFSLGAEKYVPKGAAKQTVEELADLFGFELKLNTEVME